MSGTQTLIDALMKKYLLLKDDIKTNSRHVHNPDLVKIQMNQEARLTDDDKAAVQPSIFNRRYRQRCRGERIIFCRKRPPPSGSSAEKES